jgi:hypothetical protein
MEAKKLDLEIPALKYRRRAFNAFYETSGDKQHHRI